MDTLTLTPHIAEPSVYQRINDLLDDSEIIELSKERHLLGFPSKAKIAMINIKRRVRNITKNRKYSELVAVTTDLIQIIGSSANIKAPLQSAYRILGSLQISSYNPPIVDLELFKRSISQSFYSSRNWSSLYRICVIKEHSRISANLKSDAEKAAAQLLLKYFAQLA